MTSERADDRANGWLTGALDPAANVRTLLDPRGAGRRIAEDFADQILARLDGQQGGTSGGTSGGNGGTPPTDPDLVQALRELRADAARVGDVSADLLEHLFVLLSALLTRVPSSQGKSGTQALSLGHVLPGEPASGLFYVHNTGAGAVAEVRPHCGALRSYTGAELEPGLLRFDPPILDPLPPRSSCGIEVQAQLPSTAVPGTYASVILATNAPDWSLPVSLTVVDPAHGPQ